MNLYKPKKLNKNVLRKILPNKLFIDFDNINFYSQEFENIFKPKYTFSYDDEENENIFWIKTKFYSFCIYWYEYEDDICYLSDVKVKSKYQNKGFGNILLKHAIQIAVKRKFEIIYLKCLADSWIQKWYEKNGFELYEYVEIKNCSEKWVWLKRKV